MPPWPAGVLEGEAAKVAVVAVPERDMDTLGPQLAA